MSLKWQCAFLLFAAVWLVGCPVRQGRMAGQPPGSLVAAFNPEEYEEQALNRGRVYWIDSMASTVRFYLYRGGVMASKGHNHVMVVRELEGAVFLPTDMLDDGARFDLVFRAADIQVDPPGLREALGGAFASPIDAEGIAGTREHMLGKNVLSADRFPTIGLRSHRVYGELPKLVLDTEIIMHGVACRQLIAATAATDGDRLSVQGAFAVRQTDFGIEPFSAMGGALYVQDHIMIEFAIIARTTKP